MKKKKTLIGYMDEEVYEDLKFRKVWCDGNTYYFPAIEIDLWQYPKHCKELSGDPLKVRITIEKL